MNIHHIGMTAEDPIALEKFYTSYFGFKRARVLPLGEGQQIVFIKSENTYLEIFGTTEVNPNPAPENDGYPYPGLRHIAFKVESVDDKLAEMGGDAKITLGPLDFDDFIPGWRTVWVSDPAGNIVEISQGFTDDKNPAPLE